MLMGVNLRVNQSRFQPEAGNANQMIKQTIHIRLKIEGCTNHTHILRIISAIVFWVENHPKTRSH